MMNKTVLANPLLALTAILIGLPSIAGAIGTRDPGSRKSAGATIPLPPAGMGQDVMTSTVDRGAAWLPAGPVPVLEVASGKAAPNLPIPPLRRAQINRNAIVAYAHRYAQHYNGQFKSFGPQDCTNFASQALAAGGWVQEFGISLDDNTWYYNNSFWSHSWAVVGDFANFLQWSRRGVQVQQPGQLQLGDLIQADWNGTGNFTHTMIVTGRRGADLLLTYHANDNLDRSFANIRALNPRAKYRYLHLNDVYLYR